MNFPVLGLGALEADFWRLLFAMTRIGAALLAAPLFGAASVPAQVRVIVTGALAVLVCVWTPLAVPPVLFSLQGMVTLAGEALIGLAMGFVLQLAFVAPVLAAEVVGGGMGLGMAAAADPHSGVHSPALGQYFGVVLTLVFLGTGAHLHWLRLLVDSYAVFPPGQAWLGAERLMAVAGFGSSLFAAAVAIALPVTLILLLVQVLTGVLSRSAPSLNLFALGLPAGLLAGLAALIVTAPMLTDRMTDLSGQAILQVASLLAK